MTTHNFCASTRRKISIIFEVSGHERLPTAELRFLKCGRAFSADAVQKCPAPKGGRKRRSKFLTSMSQDGARSSGNFDRRGGDTWGGKGGDPTARTFVPEKRKSRRPRVVRRAFGDGRPEVVCASLSERQNDCESKWVGGGRGRG